MNNHQWEIFEYFKYFINEYLQSEKWPIPFPSALVLLTQGFVLRERRMNEECSWRMENCSWGDGEKTRSRSVASKIKENILKTNKSQIPEAKYTNVCMSPFSTICKLFLPRGGSPYPGLFVVWAFVKTRTLKAGERVYRKPWGTWAIWFDGWDGAKRATRSDRPTGPTTWS